MAQKKRKSFEQCLKDMKKAMEYKIYIEDIKKKYKLDEKEEFIQKVLEYQKDEKFLEDFAFKLSSYVSTAIRADFTMDLWSILEKYGGEVDTLVDGYYQVRCYEKDFYIYREYSGCFQVEEQGIVSFPTSLDIISLFDELEKFERICMDEIEKKAKIAKEKKEKEEYDLYLKLKEKYEKD